MTEAATTGLPGQTMLCPDSRMPRHILDKILPGRGQLRGRWFLRPFEAVLHDPALWSTHRRNVLRAMAAGLFIAFIPFPIHTALAGITAVCLRMNVAVAILVSWIANPLTMGPMYYGAYNVGLWLLRQSPLEEQPEFTLAGLADGLELVWQPLLLGCLVCGVGIATLGYLTLNWLWIRQTRRRFRRRNACPSRR